MQIVELYRYVDGGKMIVSPNKQNATDTPYKYRVIAEEGMLLQKGNEEVLAKDTDNPEGWIEIIDKDYIPFEMEVEAYNVLFE